MRAQQAACGPHMGRMRTTHGQLYANHTWAAHGPHTGCTCSFPLLGSPGPFRALPGSLGSILGHCSAICYSFGLFTLDSDKNKIWQRIWQLLSSDWLRDLSCQSHFFQKWVRWLLNRCSTVRGWARAWLEIGFQGPRNNFLGYPSLTLND